MTPEMIAFMQFSVVSITVGVFVGSAIYYFILRGSNKKLKAADRVLKENGNGVTKLQETIARGPRDSTFLTAIEED